MKALSLIQPWASLIHDGRKTIETRSWSTKYRGELAIHASMKVDKEACKQFGYDPKTIERGKILCIVTLMNCVQFPSPLAKPDEYGDFTAGRYGWILHYLIKLSAPIHAKGSLGLWNFDALDKIKQTRLMK
jgi:hypothetical protein